MPSLDIAGIVTQVVVVVVAVVVVVVVVVVVAVVVVIILAILVVAVALINHSYASNYKDHWRSETYKHPRSEDFDQELSSQSVQH